MALLASGVLFADDAFEASVLKILENAGIKGLLADHQEHSQQHTTRQQCHHHLAHRGSNPGRRFVEIADVEFVFVHSRFSILDFWMGRLLHVMAHG